MIPVMINMPNMLNPAPCSKQIKKTPKQMGNVEARQTNAIAIAAVRIMSAAMENCGRPG